VKVCCVLLTEKWLDVFNKKNCFTCLWISWRLILSDIHKNSFTQTSLYFISLFTCLVIVVHELLLLKMVNIVFQLLCSYFTFYTKLIPSVNGTGVVTSLEFCSHKIDIVADTCVEHDILDKFHPCKLIGVQVFRRNTHMDIAVLFFLIK
jgi:hypothetical protein